MRRVLFLFLDGVGLGESDVSMNPLVAGHYPTLMRLTNDRPLVAATGRVSTALADLFPLDARMGVDGRPQSATGQAALITGVNAPTSIAEHYGPRPDHRIRAIVRDRNLFQIVRDFGLRAGFSNAYPPGFFAAVARGKRLLSVMQYAVHTSGISLNSADELWAGCALSADYTNLSWRKHLGYRDIPVYEPAEAGAAFWAMAQPYSFYLHDHWITDELGHHRDLSGAVANFERFDSFLAGILAVADMTETLIVVVADHGNVEDCSHGKHTLNPALCLLIGARDGLRLDSLHTLADLAPVLLRFLSVSTA